MKRFYLAGFALLLAFDTLNLVCFRFAGLHAAPVTLLGAAWFAQVFSYPWTYGAIAGYLGAFVTWMTLLKHAPIGPAFAASHLEVVSVIVLSWLVFGESVTTLQIVGTLVIVAGVACLAAAERAATAPVS